MPRYDGRWEIVITCGEGYDGRWEIVITCGEGDAMVDTLVG